MIENNSKIITVSQLNNIIKNIVENEIILENLIVIGEISSYSVTRNIAYITIKDEDSILNCVLFNAGSFVTAKMGDLVLLKGSVKYYARGGRLSFNATYLELYGQGKLYQQFLQLKEKLQSEGLFDEKYKKPLPHNINKIGVITSKTGAVIQDIINITQRRNPSLNIVIYDVLVQGALAAKQICGGLEFFSDYESIDLVIVARGGGSIEDLQPFNDESVARACFDCKKYVISAIGHETDYTIIDFIADLRAPTPSAAAELVSKDYTQLKKEIKTKLEKSKTILSNNISNFINLISIKKLTMQKNIQLLLQDVNLVANELNMRLKTKLEKMISDTTYKVHHIVSLLDTLSPTKLLAKGYSITTKNGYAITDCKSVTINDIITTTISNGELYSQIINIKEKV